MPSLSATSELCQRYKRYKRYKHTLHNSCFHLGDAKPHNLVKIERLRQTPNWKTNPGKG